jgi:hypothetical protein
MSAFFSTLRFYLFAEEVVVFIENIFYFFLLFYKFYISFLIILLNFFDPDDSF